VFYLKVKQRARKVCKIGSGFAVFLSKSWISLLERTLTGRRGDVRKSESGLSSMIGGWIRCFSAAAPLACEWADNTFVLGNYFFVVAGGGTWTPAI
jgi:hypothetical protein